MTFQYEKKRTENTKENFHYVRLEFRSVSSVNRVKLQVATRAYESLKNVLANLAVVFQNFHWPWPVGRGLS